MRERRWQKNPGLMSVLLLLFILLISAAVMEGNTGDKRILKDVSAEETLELIEENSENPDFVILDVRTPSEFKNGYLEGAQNIDYYAGIKKNEKTNDFYPEAFREELQNLDKNKTYLIYCASGNRSGKALKIMDEMGFTKAYNMLGGFEEWSSKGLPFVR